MATSALTVVLACTASDPHPPTAVEGASGGATPCERAGYRCAVTACLTGTVTTGGSLGCPGEGAVCCQVAPDGGHDGGADASESDADAAVQPVDGAAGDAALD